MNFEAYLSTCATVAGALIGLLFVAISLRYAEILGDAASLRNRAMAKGAFLGLADALGASLLALLSPEHPGIALILVGAIATISTARTQLGLAGTHTLTGAILPGSTGAYLLQIAVGSWLIAQPAERWLRQAAGYVIIMVIAVVLVRCWLLLLPSHNTATTTTTSLEQR